MKKSAKIVANVIEESTLTFKYYLHKVSMVLSKELREMARTSGLITKKLFANGLKSFCVFLFLYVLFGVQIFAANKGILILEPNRNGTIWLDGALKSLKTDLLNQSTTSKCEIAAIDLNTEESKQAAIAEIKAFGEASLLVAGNVEIAKFMEKNYSEIGYKPAMIVLDVNPEQHSEMDSLPNVTGILNKRDVVNTAIFSTEVLPQINKIVFIIFGKTTESFKVRTKDLISNTKELAHKNSIFIYADEKDSAELSKSLKIFCKSSIIIPIFTPEIVRADYAKYIEVMLTLKQSIDCYIFSTDDYGLRSIMFGGVLNFAENYAKQIHEKIKTALRQPDNLSDLSFDIQYPQKALNYALVKSFPNLEFNIPNGTLLLGYEQPWFVKYMLHAIILLVSFVMLFAFFAYAYGLKKRRDFLLSLHDYSSVCTFVADESGNILFLKNQDKCGSKDYSGIKHVRDLPADIKHLYYPNAEEIFKDKKSRAFYFNIDGCSKTAKMHFKPQSSSNPDVVIWTSQDVSDFQNVSENYEALRIKFESTLDLMLDHVIIVDQTDTIVMHSKSILSILAPTEKTLVGKKFSKLVAEKLKIMAGPQDSLTFEAMRTNKRVYSEALFENDGQKIYLTAHIEPLCDKNGATVGAILVGKDVTEMRIKEGRLESAEAMNNALAEKSKIICFTLNENLEDIYWYVPESFGIGKKVGRIDAKAWNPEDYAKYKQDIVKLQKGEIDILTFRTKPVLFKDLHIDVSVTKQNMQISGKTFYFGFAQNVSALVDVERKYNESSMLLGTILDNIPCSIFVKDLTHGDRYIMANPQYCRLLGLDRSEIVGNTDENLQIKRTSDEVVKEGDEQLMLQGKKVLNFEENITSKTDKNYFVQTSKVGVLADSRNLMIGISVDITKLKKLENELRAKNFLFEDLLDNMPVGIYAKDLKTNKFVLWNKYLAEMTNMPQERAIGRGDVEHELFPQNANDLLREDKAIVQNNAVSDVIKQLQPKEGSEFIARLWRKPFGKGTSDPMIFGMVLDMTQTYNSQSERDLLMYEIENFAHRESVLNECLSMLVSDGDFDFIIRNVLRKLGECVGADIASLITVSPNGSKLHLSNLWQKNPDSNPNISKVGFIMPITQQWSDMLLKGDSIIIPDARKLGLHDAIRLTFGGREVGSAILVGIRHNHTLWGTISMTYFEARTFSQTDEKFMRAMASNMELAIVGRISLEAIKRNEKEKSIIFDNISSPIHFFDGDGNMIGLNTAAENYWGKSREKILSSPCYITICGNDDYPEFCPIKKAIKLGKPYTEEYFLADRSFISSVMPVYGEDGKIKNFVECITDTTMQTKAKTQIESAKVAAESSNKAKSLFLATMSHEIRTPLNAILGLSEILLVENTDKKSSTHEYADSINTAGKALLSIINDVLELSKIEADKLEIEYDWMNLAVLLEETKQIFTALASKKNLELKYRLESAFPDIYFSTPNLRQILINIIGNAIKFTAKGGVSVSLTTVKVDGNRIDFKIAIKDTGRGIPKEDFEKIFNAFEQSSLRRSDISEGTGLGLAIVTRLVTRLGGKISLDSTVGKGSTFTLEFSGIEKREHKMHKPINKLPAAKLMEGLKVWVVDDVEMNCKVLSMLLKKMGADCDYMISANKALERLKANDNPPDFLMTDLWMPEMNGEEFANEFSKIRPDIPIVAVTADTEAQSNFSMNSFKKLILKPVSMEKLANLYEELNF